MNVFWKNVASVLTGTATAQSIPIFGSLIIARLYAPVAYGAYSAWLGAVLILAVVLTGRFETALAIEEDGTPRRRGVAATLLTSIAAACAATILLAILLIVAPSILKDMPTLLVVIAIPTALLLAATQTWTSWAAAEAYYHRLSWMRIVQAASITVCQIGAGIFFKSAESLAASYLVGVGIAAGFSLRLMPLKSSDFHSMKNTLRWFWSRHRRFPFFSLPADSISTVGGQLPIFIITHRFGSEIAGLLALTMRTLGAPTGLLGASVLDVFKRHAAASYRMRGECSAEYMQTLKVLALGAIVFCIVLFFSSEWLFVLAFGEKWRPSGAMAIWLLPLFAMRFVASPLSYMAYIAGKQHLDLLWQIGLLMMTYLTLTLNASYTDALKMYSLGYALLYIIYLWMSYRFSLGKQF